MPSKDETPPRTKRSSAACAPSSPGSQAQRIPLAQSTRESAAWEAPYVTLRPSRPSPRRGNLERPSSESASDSGHHAGGRIFSGDAMGAGGAGSLSTAEM